jgi:GNAT superfamily N-acetyltransferase
MRVPAAATWELRQVVLRPERLVHDMALSDDDEPLTATFAAVSVDGEVVGCVRVAPDAHPPGLVGTGVDGTSPWRLRGMATRQDLRNAGIGSRVLARATAYVSEQGGGLIWCNARVPAVGLYRRAGFVDHGAIWEEPPIGPHVIMWKMVAGAGHVDSATGADRP